MWNLKSVTAQNAFSYESLNFDVVSNSTNIVYGINKTDTGVLSNGSGKSSIIDIICIGITGSSLRNVDKKDLVRNGCTNGSIDILLYNSITKDSLLIKRIIHISKTNKVEIYLNDKLEDSLVDLNPNESNKYILNKLQVNYDDIINYFLISEETYQSFFLSNDSTKKEVINRFCKADKIDKADELIFNKIKLIDDQLKSLEIQIKVSQSKIEDYKKELETEKNLNIDLLRQQIIDKINENIRLLNVELESNKTNLLVLSKSISIKNTSLEQLNLNIDTKKIAIDEIDTNINELSQVILELQTELLEVDNKYKDQLLTISKSILEFDKLINHNQTQIRLYSGQVSTIERSIEDSIKCPKCEHSFSTKDALFDLKVAKDNIISLKNKIVHYTKLKEACESDILRENKKKNDIRLLIDKDKKSIMESIEESKKMNLELLESKKRLTNELDSYNKEKKVISNEIQDLMLKIDSLTKKNQHADNEIVNNISRIEEEKNKVYESKIEAINNKIELEELTILNLHQDFNQISEHRANQESLRIHFKKFKTYLANNSLSIIEYYTNHYLELMKSNLKISIDGYKELSNGKIKDEISIGISRDGLNVEKYSKFSRGEKSKANIACILAMQKIINLNTNAGGFNLLFIDEILEAVDGIGMKEIISALNDLKQTIFVITHVDQDNTYEGNKLIVEKIDGMSKLVS